MRNQNFKCSICEWVRSLQGWSEPLWHCAVTVSTLNLCSITSFIWVSLRWHLGLSKCIGWCQRPRPVLSISAQGCIRKDTCDMLWYVGEVQQQAARSSMSEPGTRSSLWEFSDELINVNMSTHSATSAGQGHHLSHQGPASPDNVSWSGMICR